jgi:hypothetical protein
MARKAKKAKGSDNAGTPWWGGSYVVARRNPRGAYCPENTYWRKARSPHEAILGIEEITDDEPEWLPLTEQEATERARLGSQNAKRMYDVHYRMLLRCGLKPRDPEVEYVRVASTPFPSGWTPMNTSCERSWQN